MSIKKHKVLLATTLAILAVLITLVTLKKPVTLATANNHTVNKPVNHKSSDSISLEPVKLFEYSDNAFFTLEDYTSLDKLDGKVYFNNIELGIKKEISNVFDIRLYQGVFYNYATDPGVIVYPAVTNERKYSCNSKNPYCAISAFYISVDGGENFMAFDYIKSTDHIEKSRCFAVIATDKKVYLIQKEQDDSRKKNNEYNISEYELDIIADREIPPFSYHLLKNKETGEENLIFGYGYRMYEGKIAELEPYRENMLEIDNYCGKKDDSVSSFLVRNLKAEAIND